MMNDQKNPEEPAFLSELKGAAKDMFNEARQNLNDTIDDTMRIAHSGVEIVKDSYEIVEKKVGRDRLVGAALGAKAGGLFFFTKPHPAVPAYLASIGVGAALGAVVGFVAGPKVIAAYKRANGMDESNDNKNEEPKAPTVGPKDPSP